LQTSSSTKSSDDAILGTAKTTSRVPPAQSAARLTAATPGGRGRSSPGPRRPRAQPPQSHRAPGRPRAGTSVDEGAVLEAALRAFAVGGYDGVSVRTLSKQLGVSHGWVNQRFGSKDGLWYAAVDHGFGGQAARITFDPTISDPLEQLEHGIRQFMHYSAEHPEVLLLMNVEGARDTERLTYIYENYIEPVAAPFERLLRHLIDEARVRPVPMRTLFLMVTHGGAAPFTLVPLARRLERSDPLSAKKVGEHIEAVVRIVVDGLRA
jgi:TetR/AcrR family transcriptional regulator